MVVLVIIAAIALVVSYIKFNRLKRIFDLREFTIDQYLNSTDELKRTIAMGLYLRFKSESKESEGNTDEEKPEKYSKIFIRENPISFEHFVAQLFETTRGGFTHVTPPSGDFGVDFEHIINDQLYLGQTKCHKEDLSFEPIALLHSNMVKRGAAGGYVVTTSGFSDKAKQYAQGLNIELIDGKGLSGMWLESLKVSRQIIKQFDHQVKNINC